MKVENVGDYWIATGGGPLRRIIAEGGTRQEARHNFMLQHVQQYQKVVRGLQELGIMRGFE